MDGDARTAPVHAHAADGGTRDGHPADDGAPNEQSSTATASDAGASLAGLPSDVAALKELIAEERSRRARLNDAMMRIRAKVAEEVARLEGTIAAQESELARVTARAALLEEEAAVSEELLRERAAAIERATREAQHATFARDCMAGDMDELRSQVRTLKRRVHDLRVSLAAAKGGALPGDEDDEDEDGEEDGHATAPTDGVLGASPEGVSGLKSQLAAVRMDAEAQKMRADAAAEEATELRTQLQAAQRELEELRARPRLELATTAAGVNVSALTSERDALRAEVERRKADIAKLTAELEKTKDGAANDKLAKARSITELRDTQAQLAEAAAARDAALEEKATALARVRMLQAEVSKLTDRCARAEATVEDLRRASQAAVASRTADTSATHAETKARAEVAALQQEVTSYVSKNASLTSQLSAANIELTAVREEAATAMTRARTLDGDHQRLTAALAAATNEVESLRERCSELQRRATTAERDAAAARSSADTSTQSRIVELDNLRVDLRDTQQRLAAAHTECTTLTAQLRARDEELAALRARLEAEIAAHRAAEDDLGKATEYGRVLLSSNRELQAQLKQARVRDDSAPARPPAQTYEDMAKLSSQMVELRAALTAHSQLLNASALANSSLHASSVMSTSTNSISAAPAVRIAGPDSVPSSIGVTPADADAAIIARTRAKELNTELLRERQRRMDVESEVRSLQQTLAALAYQQSAAPPGTSAAAAPTMPASASTSAPRSFTATSDAIVRTSSAPASVFADMAGAFARPSAGGSTGFTALPQPAGAPSRKPVADNAYASTAPPPPAAAHNNLHTNLATAAQVRSVLHAPTRGRPAANRVVTDPLAHLVAEMDRAMRI